MAEYRPNPLRETYGIRRVSKTPTDLSEAEAEQLLNDSFHCLPVPGKKQSIGVRFGRIYVFQPDGIGGYHAYPISGNELCKKYHGVKKKIAQMLGRTVKNLSQDHHV